MVFGRAELLIENTNTSLAEMEHVPPPGSEKRNQFHAILSSSCKVGMLGIESNSARLFLFKPEPSNTTQSKFSISGLSLLEAGPLEELELTPLRYRTHLRIVCGAAA